MFHHEMAVCSTQEHCLTHLFRMPVPSVLGSSFLHNKLACPLHKSKSIRVGRVLSPRSVNSASAVAKPTGKDITEQAEAAHSHFLSPSAMVETPMEPSQHGESSEFAGIMPKEETGVLRFLKEHPEYDGRGVVVAIFDTGVDPGAKGLQETTDGRRKIIDVVDCTGSGDVDTSTVQEAADGHLKGLYGRNLKLNPTWENPEGKWHVGAKRLFELFPGGLKKRIQAERRKHRDQHQNAAVTAAAAAVAAFERQHSKLSTEQAKELEELQLRLSLLQGMQEKLDDLGPLLDCVVWHDGSCWRAALDTSELHEPGSTAGQLAVFVPLTDYKAEQRFATFSAVDSCNFALNIYDDGNVLSIVVDAGSHGTHVAGITAGHHPDDPLLNGNAPGAQIISCKIGDTRLGSMETNVGLTRALITVLEHKADLINLSYGESTATPNMGRFIELANEVVNKHNVIFVSSAGNAGPALSTVGAPGGTTSSIIAIGAYVSPELAAAGHSVRLPLAEGQQYTWSSRGPTPDGHTGVVLSAPGGAIAPVPQWTQQSRQLMNGTSMSSPNACGAIALVLCGLKQLGQQITPNRVRRALENTAAPLGGDAPDAVVTYGRGLIQVDKAFEYLGSSADADRPDVRYQVTVRRSDSAATNRGILLRDTVESAQPRTFACEVSPQLHEDADVRSEKLAVEDRIRLSCAASWVQHPATLFLPHNGRGFEVLVDPTQLPEGMSYTEVLGWESTAAWRGPLFRVPVTVIKPAPVHKLEPASSSPAESSGGAEAQPQAGPGADQQLESHPIADLAGGPPGNGPASTEYQPPRQGDWVARLGTLHFQAGTELRRFIAVPEGASWAEMSIRAGAYDTPRNFMLRATQLQPHTRYSDTEWRTYAALSGHAQQTHRFKVVAAACLEVTLSQFWSSLGPGELTVEVAFHGVQLTNAASLAIDGAAGNCKVIARAPLRQEKVKPKAELTHLRIPLRPTEWTLTPLAGARDQLPEQRTIHSLVLTYKFTAEEAGKYKPTVPMLNRYVYDGVFEAQFFMLHDSNKRLLALGDIYPEAKELKKGDYVIKLMLRHDDAALLGKMKALPVLVERSLAQSIDVPVYPTNSDSVRQMKPLKDERVLAAGESLALFVGPVPVDKLPKDATAGRSLAGTLQLGLQQGSKQHAPGNFPLTYSVAPKAKSDDVKATDEDAGQPSQEEKLREAVRDAEVKFLQGFNAHNVLHTSLEEAEAYELRLQGLDSEKEAECYTKLRKRLLEAWPGHLPLLQERVQRMGKAKDKQRTPEQGAEFWEEVAEAADAVVAAVDEGKLAKHLARKTPVEGLAATKDAKQHDEAKAALIEALRWKCEALLQSSPGQGRAEAGAAGAADAEEVPQEQEASAAAQIEEDPFEAAFQHLRQYSDTIDRELAVLHARREERHGRFATALKILAKQAEGEDKPAPRGVLQLRADLAGKLGWSHWQSYELSRLHDRFPAAYPLF